MENTMTVTKIYYAGGGFYSASLHGAIPEGAVEIDEELREALLDGQSAGKVIMPPDAEHDLPWLADPPPPSMEQLLARFADRIQERLDDFAMTRNYDGILAAASYAAGKNAKFALEGRYAVEIRDATWARGYEIMDDVLCGRRPMPSMEKALAELPTPVWPAV